MTFLVSTPEEMETRGWQTLDVVLVTGDSHVDHPSFPANLIGRVLESAGFRTGLISRPDPRDPKSVQVLGLPRLFFGVTAGALDSMVANYTALKKKRSDDPYSPDGRAGGRPDRALTVYCNLIRRTYGKSAFVVAGGIEASLRRFAHYDYWSDSVRRPILMDCGADALVHGMGEKAAVEIARRLDTLYDTDTDFRERRSAGSPCDPARQLDAIRDVAGLCYRVPQRLPLPENALVLPSDDAVRDDPEAHLAAFRTFETRSDCILVQDCGGMRVVSNPREMNVSTEELDGFYDLPFTRNPHPSYDGARIPALEQVRFSVTTHRGCFGGCAFCAIGAHQSKQVRSRSERSILEEVARIAAHPEFRGTLRDLGGPTANMYGLRCTREKPCRRPSCLWPERCRHLDVDQRPYVALLRAAMQRPGVKHLFVSSGIRMDLALHCTPLIRALAQHHTSGLLKVAPEHVVPTVLQTMRKPEGNDFDAFEKRFSSYSRDAGKKQFVLPYLMAAHPGCRLEDMVKLALFLREHRLHAEQCQIFTPTPGTASTVMYATGRDPATGRAVFVEKRPEFKRLQKALILHHLPQNAPLVREALKQAGRSDLAPRLLSAAGKNTRKRQKRTK